MSVGLIAAERVPLGVLLRAADKVKLLVLTGKEPSTCDAIDGVAHNSRWSRNVERYELLHEALHWYFE